MQQLRNALIDEYHCHHHISMIACMDLLKIDDAWYW